MSTVNFIRATEKREQEPTPYLATDICQFTEQTEYLKKFINNNVKYTRREEKGEQDVRYTSQKTLTILPQHSIHRNVQPVFVRLGSARPTIPSLQKPGTGAPLCRASNAGVCLLADQPAVFLLDFALL